MDLSTLATVTVTFRPDLDILKAQLAALPESSFKVIVDNASPFDALAGLRKLAADGHCSLLIENPANRGLPAALNQGVRLAMRTMPSCRYVLFLDQDTEPSAEGVAGLLHQYLRLRGEGRNPGCVGPRLVDAASGLEHGFHRIAGWRWVRCFPRQNAEPVECSNLNCSGTLLEADLFDRIGGLDEDLFMDHLDTDWSFRVLAGGFRLYGVPSVTFRHRMGLATWRIWLLGWRIWPYRSPERHFLLFRNAIRLMRRRYVPRVWKFWAAVKLAMTMTVHLVMDPRRRPQLAAMARGLAAGLRS